MDEHHKRIVYRDIQSFFQFHCKLWYYGFMVKRKQFPHIFAPYCIAFERSVGAIIYRTLNDKNIEYLLLKYRNGHWEFPRGKVEDSELEQETMYREIREETGIERITIIKDFRETMRFSYVAHGREREERKKEKSCLWVRKTAVFYLAHADHENVELSEEHHAAVWLSYEDAIAKLTYQNARDILLIAHKTIKDVA
jgi:bis(5'-nucleosidyl)-tetraphosphatase